MYHYCLSDLFSGVFPLRLSTAGQWGLAHYQADYDRLLLLIDPRDICAATPIGDGKLDFPADYPLWLPAAAAGSNRYNRIIPAGSYPMIEVDGHLLASLPLR